MLGLFLSTTLAMSALSSKVLAAGLPIYSRSVALSDIASTIEIMTFCGAGR